MKPDFDQLKEFAEKFKDQHQLTGTTTPIPTLPRTINDTATCPFCGSCPTCGRRTSQFQVTYNTAASNQ